jgi:hypothetical protein
MKQSRLGVTVSLLQEAADMPKLSPAELLVIDSSVGGRLPSMEHLGRPEESGFGHPS